MDNIGFVLVCCLLNFLYSNEFVKKVVGVGLFFIKDFMTSSHLCLAILEIWLATISSIISDL